MGFSSLQYLAFPIRIIAVFNQIPELGLGLSLSLAEKPTPKDIFAETDAPFYPQFIEYAGLCDVTRNSDEVAALQAHNTAILFHPSFINFCGSFENKAAWLMQANQHIQSVQSPWFAQDCAYCFWQDKPAYSSQFGFFIPPILNEASLQVAIKRVKEVQAYIDVPLAIEPPPVTFSVGQMPFYQFFGQLAESCDCALLLDVGHLVSYELATGHSLADGLQDFPFERVIEVHIAGGKLLAGSEAYASKPMYIDAHEHKITDEAWAMFDFIIPKLSQLKAVCYECEGVEQEEIFAVLARLQAKLLTLSIAAAFKAKLSELKRPAVQLAENAGLEL